MHVCWDGFYGDGLMGCLLVCLVFLVSDRWLTVLQVSIQFPYSVWKEEELEEIERNPTPL